MSEFKVIVILTVLLMAGCEALDSFECYSSVKKAYPEAIIKRLPGSKYRFLVRLDNGEVRLVTTLNFSDAEITADVIIFNGE